MRSGWVPLTRSVPPFLPDDVARWSAPLLIYDGYEQFEFGYGIEPKASMLQVVMGQNGPVLEAASAVCLLIPIYVLKHKIGLIIHLWRDEDLGNESAELIRKPFEQYPEIAVEPIVGFVSSQTIRTEHATQIGEAKALIETLAPSARFHDIIVQEPKTSPPDPNQDPMGVEIHLDTEKGVLDVRDDFGPDQTIMYQGFR